MPAKNDFIVDPKLLDLNRPIVTLEGIRKLNLQGFEFEQLSGILYEDVDQRVCAGYLKTSEDDYWVRGHMPGMPLMPGVLMLESVAQLASFFTQRHDLLGAEIVGFGGVDGVRFRGVVLPGDTLILLMKLSKVRRGRMIIADFQGLVDNKLVVDGTIRGIPLPVQGVKEFLAEKSIDKQPADGPTQTVND